MLTPEGPKVLEYNARFGDPEAQVVLPRMKNDIIDVFEACIDGTLDQIDLQFEDNACVCVVLASDGYPLAYEKGFEITGMENFKDKDGYYLFHAGSKFDENGKIVGSVCVNLDVSDFLNAQRALHAFVQYPMSHHAPMTDMDALATKNVDDILQYYMKQAELLVGKPMGLMNKAEKIRALDYLDQKGVFKISKTSVLLCETLQVSKYTLYNYLEEARSKPQAIQKAQPDRSQTFHISHTSSQLRRMNLFRSSV